MSARSAPLVGRDPEIGVIDASLRELDNGRGGILALAGEPGIGKTRLADEAGERATALGHLVLSGRAAEIERDQPFAVVLLALDDYLASLDQAAFDGLGSETLSQLGVIFPSFGGFAGPSLQAERHRSYRAVRAMLEALSGSGPVVVIFDDLHWADAASVELLGYLLRTPPRGVLLMLAFRPAQLPAALAVGVERAGREGSANLLRLGPLSTEQADRFVGLHVAADKRAELYSQSGGNPFYLEELTRVVAIEAPPSVREIPGFDVDVPEAVRAALAAELDAVDGPPRRLLEGGAVAGDPFDVGLAAEAAQTPEPDALADLDLLVRAELIGPTEVPRRFRFRHPLVRHAVYELSGAGWRIGAHARLAETLASRGAPASDRAHHLERSASIGDDGAIAALTQAGEAARDPATAARWFDAALRLLPEELGRTERSLHLAAALATALGVGGRVHEARELLCRILEELPPDAHETRAQLVAFTANVEHHLGLVEDAHGRLVQALGDLPDRASVAGSLLQIELCFSFTLLGHGFDEARSLAEAALETARDLGNPPLTAGAAAIRAYIDGVSPFAGDMTERLAESARLMDELTDAEVAAHLDGPLKLAHGEIFLERFADAARHLRRGIEIARATGQGQTIWIMRIAHVLALVPLGRLTEAASAADDAVDASRLTGSRAQLTWALAARCAVATAAGDVQAAAALVEESAPSEIEARRPFFAFLGSVFPQALLEAGDASGAQSLLSEVFRYGDIPGFMPAGRAQSREIATRTALVLDRREDAEARAVEAADLAAGVPLMMPTVFSRRAAAWVALAAGDNAGAAKLSLEAAEAAESVGARIEAARSRALAGRALGLDGRREQAVRELARAEGELAACGAEGYRAEAARALRSLGRRVAPGRRAGALSGVDSLTPRELEVAQLVADNKSSREIAAQLYVSPKTVETHLAHIFAKLGVSSRKAVGPVLERHEQLTSTR